jgi:membrane associated rhomboid family serine protease
MFLPIRTDSPLRSTPWMNWAIIFANFVCFVIQRRLHLEQSLSLDPGNPELVHYFSYAFLHRDWMHLIFNMLFLYIFGNNVNDKMGNVGYLGFYLAGGVFAGVGHVLSSSVPVIGASGAVSAVTGAYLVLFPRSNITVIYFFILIGSFEIASMYFIIFFFVKDLIPVFAAAESEIAHMAHISGTVFGIVVCMVMLAANLLPRDQFDVMSMLRQWNRRRQYQNLVRDGYDPFTYVSPIEEPARARATPPDPMLGRIQDLRAEISEAVAHHNLPHAAHLFLKLKQLDPKQVLSRQAQLDVANQLASQQNYAQAVEAYEQFLQHYPNFEQIEQVQLMLGIIYARYTSQPERAKELLLRAMARLHSDREIEMARAELGRIATASP